MQKEHRIACEIVKNPEVNELVTYLTSRIFGLTYDYLQLNGKNPHTELGKILGGTSPENAGTVGQDFKTLYQVAYHGNLREKMSMIMYFSYNICHLGWFLLIGLYNNDLTVLQLIRKYNISTEDLWRRIRRIESIMAAELSDIIDLCPGSVVTCQNCDIICRGNYPNVCTLFNFHSEGPVSFSRQMNPKLRAKQTQNPTSWKQSQICPPLSKREKKLLGITSKTQPLPWRTGRSTFELNPENPYVMLDKQSGTLAIGGPSGHSDLLFNSALIFEPVYRNMRLRKLFTLALIGWMASLDHSIHSIAEALSVPPFNMPYDNDWSPMQYIHILLN